MGNLHKQVTIMLNQDNSLNESVSTHLKQDFSWWVSTLLFGLYCAKQADPLAAADSLLSAWRERVDRELGDTKEGEVLMNALLGGNVREMTTKEADALVNVVKNVVAKIAVKK